MPLRLVVHDDCDIEKSWITRCRKDGDLAAAECGGEMVSHLKVLRRHGLPTHKRRSFAVKVAPGIEIDVYVYRKSRAVMHVAVNDEVALVLTLQPHSRPIDSTNARNDAETRLLDWWQQYGQL